VSTVDPVDMGIVPYDILWIGAEVFALDEYPQGFPLQVHTVLSAGSRAGEGTDQGERHRVHVRGYVLDAGTGAQLRGRDQWPWQIRLSVPHDQPRATYLPPLRPDLDLAHHPEPASAMVGHGRDGYFLDGLVYCQGHDAPMQPSRDGLGNRFYGCTTIRCMLGLVPATLLENLAWIHLTRLDPSACRVTPDARTRVFTHSVSWLGVGETVADLTLHMPTVANTTVIMAGRRHH
jgi:hypothetical protein